MTKLDLDQFFARLLELLVRHNPYDLNYSKISRATGVPRATLYYYFGKDKQTVIDEAVKFGVRTFVRLYQMEQNLKDHSNWHDFQKRRLYDVFRMAHLNPWAPALYFRFRTQKNVWGEEIRNIENAYVEKLSKAWEFYNKTPVDPQKMRFANYLKLGALWGVADEFEAWFGKDREKITPENLQKIDQMASQLTAIVTQALT